MQCHCDAGFCARRSGLQDELPQAGEARSVATLVKSSHAAPSGYCVFRMSLASAMKRGIASLGFSTWPGAMQVWPALSTLPLMILRTAWEKRAAFALIASAMRTRCTSSKLTRLCKRAARTPVSTHMTRNIVVAAFRYFVF